VADQDDLARQQKHSLVHIRLIMLEREESGIGIGQGYANQEIAHAEKIAVGTLAEAHDGGEGEHQQ
jgi:hypothetical protein